MFELVRNHKRDNSCAKASMQDVLCAGFFSIITFYTQIRGPGHSIIHVKIINGSFLFKLPVTVKIMYKKVFQIFNKYCQGYAGEQ